MSSYIRIDDKVHMDKINPYAMSTMFTPGVTLGGSYSKVFSGNVTSPLVNTVNPKEDALGGSIFPQSGEKSQACVETRAAGWRTPAFCENKAFALDHPAYPMRRYDSPPWVMHDRKMRYSGPGREGLLGIPTDQTTGIASIALLAFIGLYSLYSRR